MNQTVSTESTPTRAVGRVGKVSVHDTTVSLWEEHVDEPAMRVIFRGVVARLRARGFKMEQDPEAVKRYPTLAATQYVGRKGDLEVFVETGGRTLNAEFFQNLNVSNPNGGRYDHDRLARMSRTMRLQCVVEMTWVARKLRHHGYDFGPLLVDGEVSPREVLRVAEKQEPENESPLERFNRTRGDRHGYKRDASGWPSLEQLESYGSRKDRDGRLLGIGDVKYFRAEYGPERGRLLRGRVYPRMDSLWVVDAGGEHHVVAFKLFDCDHPEREPRRLILGQRARVELELQKALVAQRYDRVEVLARVLHRLSERPPFYVLDKEKGLWWRENGGGYTPSLAHAGRYSESKARSLERTHNQLEAVHCEEAARRFG